MLLFLAFFEFFNSQSNGKSLLGDLKNAKIVSDANPTKAESYEDPKFVPLSPSTPQSSQIDVSNEERIYIFDIDETLYPYDSNAYKYRQSKICDLAVQLGFPKKNIKKRIYSYRKIYKNSIKGILKHKRSSEIVKSIDLIRNPTKGFEKFIQGDEELKKIISGIRSPKFCFTNASKDHSYDVLKKLGILNCFKAVFYCDYTDVNFYFKPCQEAYKQVMHILNVTDPKKIYFFDDKSENINTAVFFKWNAFLIKKDRSLKDFLKNINLE